MPLQKIHHLRFRAQQRDQGAGQNLLATKGGQSRSLPLRGRTHVEFRHVADIQKPRAPVAIQDDEAVGIGEFVFRLQLAHAGKVARGIDELDHHPLAAGKLDLREQVPHVPVDLAHRRHECRRGDHDQVHRLFEFPDDPTRLGGEREFLRPREVGPPEILEAQEVRAHEQYQHRERLEPDVDPDACARDAVHALHRRYLKTWKVANRTRAVELR